jgi:hypothetical protein
MKYFIISLSMLIALEGSAQWRRAEKVYTPKVLFAHDTDIFFSTEGHGVYRFTPRNSTLIESDSGILSGETDKKVDGFMMYGSTLYAGGGGVYRSLNYGVTWEWIKSFDLGGVHALCSIDTFFIAGTDVSMRRSTNYGKNWSSVGGGETFSFARIGNIVIATGYGFWRSTDSGNSWKDVQSGGGKALTVAGGDIFSGSPYLYRSSDSGLTGDSIPTPTVTINALTSFGNYIFYGTDHSAIYMSSDRGETWQQVAKLSQDSIKDDVNITCMTVCDSFLVFGGSNLTAHSIYFRPISEIIPKSRVVQRPSVLPMTFAIYPNPANSIITIVHPLTEHPISIIDITGRVWQTLIPSIGSESTQMSIHDLSAGVYYVTDGSHHCRFVKE